MNILQNNPYRILGAYANSPIKERLANHNRMKAFLKVGKDVSFPLDLNQYLPHLYRTEATVADAESKLTLPKDQIAYAQFWFVKATPLDEVAFKHLISGDIIMAKDIWRKKETMFSLQNLIVCCLIQNNIEYAIRYAEKFYGNQNYIGQFVSAVVGDNGMSTTDDLVYGFLDTLSAEIGASSLLGMIANDDWKSYLSKKTIGPLIDSIENAIAVAKKAKGAYERLKAGETLKNETKNALAQLRALLPSSDLQYQVIADKLGIEILQCSIDYYNDSDDPYAAIKAMLLMKYANSIVVGQMAKDRCKENVDILQKAVDNLPPSEVFAEDMRIKSFLRTFSNQPSLIEHSISLIKSCAPYIVSIKMQLGKSHPYYLKISTKIVNAALSNVIAEVNEAQKQFSVVFLKETLIEAWRTQLYMDKFDLEPDYKNGRYKECRETLYGIIDNHKGFAKNSVSDHYRYGCGWCNNIDVIDVDLRTEDEIFSSCKDLESFSNYLKKFPNGKYADKVMSKIIKLRFEKCESLSDYIEFIVDYPSCKYVSEAQERIRAISTEKKEKAEKMARIALQDKALSECKTTKEVIALFKKESHDGIYKEKCSYKAYGLASSIKDYKRVISVFGERSQGGHGAKIGIEVMRRKRRNTAFLILVAFVFLFGIIIMLVSRPNKQPNHSVNNNTNTNIDVSDSDTVVVADDQYEVSNPYIDNQLKTGSKPYKDYYYSRTGKNYMKFNTSAQTDCVVIVKKCSTGAVVNHIYIRSNDSARLYLPNGEYDVFFYSGKGWNPYKEVANVVGGFVSCESIQKDGPISLYNEYVEYTLYPVENGNLHMQDATIDEAF